MAQIWRVPNQHSTEFMVGACNAATARVGTAFGFAATHLCLQNFGSVPIHYSLTSTAGASTDDPELEAAATMMLDRIVTAGLSITTSSTTTSTAAGTGNRVSVSAWEGL